MSKPSQLKISTVQTQELECLDMNEETFFANKEIDDELNRDYDDETVSGIISILKSFSIDLGLPICEKISRSKIYSMMNIMYK